MPATLAKTVTLSTTAGYHQPPPKSVTGRVRVQNLSTTAGEYVWINLSPNGVASAEGDDCVRIGPGEQYIMPALQRHSLIAAAGTPKVLIESV